MRYAYACAAIRQTSDKEAGQVCILFTVHSPLSPSLTPQALPQLFNDDQGFDTMI